MKYLKNMKLITLLRVPCNEISKESGTVHYLPHRPVVRYDKDTTKICAVFYASCDTNGTSLNNCLYSGPNLLFCYVLDLTT